MESVKYLILHDVRSAYNVGAIFRTADGAGVTKVFLSGYTPAPIDRFGRTQPEIEKTSLGASGTMPWEAVSSLPQLIEDLKTNGVTVVAVEQSDSSVPLGEFTEPSNVAYIMGNETEGIAKEMLELCDVVVDIPMLGKKESLNVSVAAGVVLYRGVLRE